jgi:hypothetical protein
MSSVWVIAEGDRTPKTSQRKTCDRTRVSPAICGFEPDDIIHSACDYETWKYHASSDVAVYYPGHVTPRITAQRGLFTCHKNPDQPYTPNILRQWVIPNGPRSTLCLNLKMFLNKCGLNDASMFPGLDGIARHVEWLHKRQLVSQQSALSGPQSGSYANGIKLAESHALIDS